MKIKNPSSQKKLLFCPFVCTLWSIFRLLLCLVSKEIVESNEDSLYRLHSRIEWLRLFFLYKAIHVLPKPSLILKLRDQLAWPPPFFFCECTNLPSQWFMIFFMHFFVLAIYLLFIYFLLLLFDRSKFGFRTEERNLSVRNWRRKARTRSRKRKALITWTGGDSRQNSRVPRK